MDHSRDDNGDVVSIEIVLRESFRKYDMHIYFKRSLPIRREVSGDATIQKGEN